MKRKYPFCILLGLLALSACGGTAQDPKSGAQEAAEATPASGIALTPEQLKAAGIGLATVGPTKIREVLPLYGVVTTNAERVREVAARYPGAIRAVEHRIGDAVRQGDVLATVESNESLQTYSVRSPISGVISVKYANAGEQTTDKPLFVVVDLSTVWVELSLFARDAAKVHKGQDAMVKSPVAEYSARGKVTYVGPFGNSNQALTARVEIPNPDNQWAPGLYVTGEVTLAEHAAATAIRSSAVQMIEGRPVVFVQAEGRFSARSVVLGKSDGEKSEILEGLAAGEVYAADNSYVIKAELRKSEAAEE